jgi:hypothetical protein
MINVTSKGIINGLSVLVNDGTGGFGPDTTLGATAPGQYGGTYTETSGIYEAINYSSLGSNTSTIFLGDGTFILAAPIQATSIHQLHINGSGKNTVIQMGSAFNGSTNGLAFNLGFNNATYYDCSFKIENFVFDFNNIVTSGSTGSSAFNIGTQNALNPILAMKIDHVRYENQTYSADGATGGRCFGSVNGIYKNFISITNSEFYNLIGDVIGFDGASAVEIANNYVQGVKVNPFIVSEVSSYINIHDNIYYETNSGTGANSGGKFFNLFFTSSNNGNILDINIHDNIVYGYPNALVLITDLTSGFTGNSYTVHVHDNDFSSLQSGASFISLGTSATSVNSVIDPFSNFGYNPSPTLSTNPPVSGTTYQNTNSYGISLKIPVTYSPTSTAAATLATGISASSTVTTSTKVSIPAGVTAGEILTYEMDVPAGWYFELVVTNATIGTAEVQAA